MNADAGPRLAITLGDVAGIGPEVVARALAEQSVQTCCRPVLIGDKLILDRAANRIGLPSLLDSLAACDIEYVPINVAGLSDVRLGAVDPRAGEAAFQSLTTAIDLAFSGKVDGIVTAPLSKYALHLAGHNYPGHTEVLAERCGVRKYAMMLYVPGLSNSSGDRRIIHTELEAADARNSLLTTRVRGPSGLAVAHATLHTSIASVPGLLSVDRISETISLTDAFLRRIGCPDPRVGVCALNPHAGEDGLFGDEEQRFIRPAVERVQQRGMDASGPFPADTLLKRAVDGEFDGIVAMYHDQGHVALKLIAFGRAVNVTLGLPIVRTSPSHGTAFDIADQFHADPAGMIAAIRLAAQLVRSR